MVYAGEFFFRCWYVGSLQEKRGKVGFSEPLIVPDLGFMRSWMVFEVLEAQIYKNNVLPFHLKDHCERLAASARLAHISDTEHLADDVESRIIVFFSDVLQHFRELSAYRINECLVWIYLTKGKTEDGFYAVSDNPTLYIFLSRKPKPSNAPLRLVTVNAGREFPYIKTTNYLFAEIDLAKKEHNHDILYTFRGTVPEEVLLLETSRRNFCAVKDGTIMTCGENVLAGITLKIVKTLAQTEDIPLCIAPVRLNDLHTCSETFTTSTTRGVVPVIRIDDIRFRAGPVAKSLQAAFQRYRKAYFRQSRGAARKIEVPKT